MVDEQTAAAENADARPDAVLLTAPGAATMLFRRGMAAAGRYNRLDRERARLAVEAAAANSPEDDAGAPPSEEPPPEAET